MGWTSLHLNTDYRGKINKKAFLDNEFTAQTKAMKWEVLKSSMVGSDYYSAVKKTDYETGESIVFGLVVITRVENECYENFSYKEMDETMHPYNYDCPITILRLLTDTDNQEAKDWRENCYRVYEAKKQQRKLMKSFNNGDKIRTKLWFDEYKTLTLTKIGNKRVWADYGEGFYYTQKILSEYPFESVYKSVEVNRV